MGKCNKARIIRHRQTGYSYGYGFIDMGSSEDAEKAIKKLNQYQIGHKRLKVAYSLPSGERTRNINLYIKVCPYHPLEKYIKARKQPELGFDATFIRQAQKFIFS